MKRSSSRSGEVSLFVVIFVTMLITVVTVSFVRLMMQGQAQSTTSDLSQSAYDSAQAGVEDAKRAIVACITVGCSTGSPEYIKLTGTCNSAMELLSDLGVSPGDNEVKVQSTGNASALDQAYTCVKVTYNGNFIGKLNRDDSKLITLSGVSDFNKVEISWYTTSDTGGKPLASLGGALSLPNPSQWDTVTNVKPPILRAQFIQYKPNFMLSDFDSGNSLDNTSRTVFMYPSNINGSSSLSALDPRQNPSTNPNPDTLSNFRCYTSFATYGGYACRATISLTSTVVAGSNPAYLRLSSLYKGTSFVVRLVNSSNTYVDFNGVQPIIDSTGRANDMFRRVQTRVEMGTDFPYPDAEMSVKGNVCKTFFVTDNALDYNPGSCTP